MNLHFLPTLVGGIANPGIGVLVFLRKKNELNKIFLFLCILIGLWNIHEFGLYIAPAPLFAVYWARVFGLGLMMIPPVFLHFTMNFIGLRTSSVRWTVLASYLVALVFVIFFWTGLLVKEYFYVISQYFPRPTRIYSIYIIFFITVAGYSISKILLKCRKTHEKSEQIRYRHLLVAVLLAIGIGATNFLVSFGVTMYPIGYAGGIAFTSIVAWTLIRHY